MNAAELIQRTQKLNDETKALQSYWSTLFPDFEALPARQCHVWLGKFRLIEIIHAVLNKLGESLRSSWAKREKNRKGYPDDPIYYRLSHSEICGCYWED